MREETRQRFERELRKRWLWRGGLVLLAMAAAGGALWMEGLDARIESREVAGIVEKVGPVSGVSTKANQTGLAVDVRLDDGREVRVLALKATDPHEGQHVSVTEHIHGTGRSTFSWK